MEDDSGYQTAYFEVQAGESSTPSFGFTTNINNGGDGSSIDFYEASNNGGELIFSMKVLSGLIPEFEVRFESLDGRTAVQAFSANLDNLVPSSEWQEFRFSLGDFFDIDNSNLVRISIAPVSAQSEMVQYQVAQLRMTSITGTDGGTDGDPTVAVMVPFAASGALKEGDTYTVPTAAQEWAGFANVDATLYPFAFTNGGKITFKASLPEGSADADIRFRFEKAPYPDVNPWFDAGTVTVTGTTEATYTIDIEARPSDETYSSLLMYVDTRDTSVVITDIQVSGNNIVSSGLSGYDLSNVQELLFDNDLAPGWVLFGDNMYGQDNGSDPGYSTAFFQVEPGDTVPQYGFEIGSNNGSGGAPIDIRDASNNGGELVFSLKVLSDYVPNFEVRLDAGNGTFHAVPLSQNIDGLVVSYDWQEFRFDLGDFFDVDLTDVVRITIAPDSPQSDVIQYKVAQLRTTN
jgi:hypothetical protein